MPDISLGRLSRLLRLQRHVHANRAPDDAASQLGVSRRTMQRDLADLRRLHAAPEETEDEVPLSGVTLTTEECRELFLLLEKTHLHRILPGFPLIGSACEKLASALPAKAAADLRERHRHISFNEAGLSQDERASAFFQTCVTALRERRVIRVTYDSVFDQGHIHTDLRIYHLTFRGRTWYAIADSQMHGGVRTFHLGRMVTTEILSENYDIPETFSVEDYFGGAWRMIRGDATHDVRVWISAVVARSVADVEWHPTQRIVWQNDGSLEFHCRVEGLTEVASWILSYGTQAKALGPPALRRELASRAAVINRYYGREE